MNTKLQQTIFETNRALEQTLGSVEANLESLLDATKNKDSLSLKGLIDRDIKIDQAVNFYTKKTLVAMTLHQPVTKNMRILTSSIYQFRAIERMGDQISNICKTTLAGLSHGTMPTFLHNLLLQMNQASLDQTVQARQSLLLNDAELCLDIREKDHKIDFLQRDVFEEGALYATQNPLAVRWSMYGVLIARAYERIGDLTVHFGEQTFYALEGKMPKEKI